MASSTKHFDCIGAGRTASAITLAAISVEAASLASVPGDPISPSILFEVIGGRQSVRHSNNSRLLIAMLTPASALALGQQLVALASAMEVPADAT